MRGSPMPRVTMQFVRDFVNGGEEEKGTEVKLHKVHGEEAANSEKIDEDGESIRVRREGIRYGG